jgi:peptidoglycan/LPS O-acetylase OafA/YrhL
MKKAILVFIVAALVLITTGVWFVSSNTGLRPLDLLQYGIIFLVVAFAVYLGIRRFNSVRKGQSAEDELSKKVLTKTAALSYYISLYIWLAMIYISDKVKLDIDVLLGAGILAMAVTFGICWMVINFRGLKNE